jgi:DNA polymerase-3 subunit alpha
MENTASNKVLCINDESFLERKREAIIETLENNVDIFFFYDTETTGLNPYPSAKAGRDRLLEVAFIAYYLDENEEFQQLMVDGKPVTFQEYINPFRESKQELNKTRSTTVTNPEALKVHGITNDFLNGKGTLGNLKLPKPAPTFKEVKPFMERFLCLDKQSDFKANVHFVAHNGKSFDDKMLTEELKYIDAYDPEVIFKRDFESLVSSSIDTKLLMMKLYKRAELEEIGFIDGVKPGHSLDYLSKMTKVDLSARSDFHGALLDSIILKDAFDGLLKSDRYQKMHNKYKFNSVATAKKLEELDKIEKTMPAFDVIQDDGKSEQNVLNIIKTDASFHEGTGTISEYVQRAKEADLNNLVMADTVSVSRFIEFYESCKENDIKPIIAANFKLETGYDIFNVFSKNKEQSAEAKALIIDIVQTASGDNSLTFEKLVSSGFKDLTAWGNLITKVKAVQSSIKNKTKTPSGLVKSVQTFLAVGNLKTKIKTEELLDVIAKHPSIEEFQGFDRITGHGDLLIIAENDDGYDTIKKLITLAHKEGQHYVPKGKERNKGEEPLINLNHIKQHNKGVFALLGDKEDVLDRALSSGYNKMADKVLEHLQSAFEGRVSLSINYNPDLRVENAQEIEAERIKRLVDFGNLHNVNPIATQKAVYANKEDYQTHINKYAILLDKKLDDFSFDVPTTPYEYLKDSEELATQFKNNQGILMNSAIIVDGITLNPVLHQPSLPKFKTEGGISQAEELKRRAYEGLDKKVEAAFKKNSKGKTYDQFYKEYQERLDYELGIIIDMDFPGYFLIKQQMIQFCKKEGIPVGAGRGSAAGSLVVYSLGITDVDPIKNDLIFERFLNPERKEMPDIDTDIDGDHREKVLNFLREEYANDGEGFEGAAYIMTKGTFSAKNTINTLGKAMGLSKFWYNDLAKIISNEPGTKLKDELEYNDILKFRYTNEVKTKRIIDQAIELEKNGGRQVSTGKHAGGIVVGNLISQAPITYVGGIPVVQFDKNDIEAAGAVKFDLLGLGTLAKLDLALKNIIEMKGEKELFKNNIKVEGKNFIYDDFEFDDSATYDLLKSANTTNVFQIESNMFKGLLKLIQPENIDEITATVSLGRPGPLSSNMHITFAESKFDESKRVKYHPLIDNLMDKTHGSIIYQEQIMAIGQNMGGFTMGGADKLRKAMGKKKPEEMERQKGIFVEGASNKGVDTSISEEIFETVEKFAGYGFNKSHAMSYALLTYKMAFLRTHYPTEFMAAILTVDANDGDSKKKLAKDIESMKEVNLHMSAPQINNSERRFRPGATTGILFGFDGITGLSANDKTKILKARESGNFTNIEDFMKRAVFGKSTEKLIDGGAMDALATLIPPTSEQLTYIKSLDNIEKKIMKRELVQAEYEVLKKTIKDKKAQDKYTIGKFNEKQVKEAYEQVFKNFQLRKDKLVIERLDKESEVLSSYVTAHPIDMGGVRNDIIKNTDREHIKMSSLDDRMLNDIDAKLNVAGLIKEVVYGRVSKNTGNTYAYLDISDGSKIDRLFLNNEKFVEINSHIKSINGVGIQEGDIVGLDISFYEQKDKGEIRISVDEMYLPKFKEKHVMKKQNNNTKQQRNNYRI